MSYPTFTQFVIDLCDDASALASFREDVLAAIEWLQDHGVSDSQINALLSESSQRINGEVMTDCSIHYSPDWRKIFVAPSYWQADSPRPYAPVPATRTLSKRSKRRSSSRKKR